MLKKSFRMIPGCREIQGTVSFGRRTVLAASALAVMLPGAFSGAVMARDTPDGSPFEALEKASGAEIGVTLRDEAGEPILHWRQDEAFAMNETVNAVLALRILEKHWKDIPVEVGTGGDAPQSPVLGKMAPGEKITFLEAARIACAENDHRAANLLLKALGGPEQLTAWVQYKGDLRTRIDRYAPENAKTTTYDVRDKTRPESITQLWQRMYIDFTPDERADFEALLRGNKDGKNLLRAQLSEGWSAADRTGQGVSDDESNRSLHAVIWDPTGYAYFAAIHVRMGAKADLAARDKVLAEAAKLVLQAAQANTKAMAG